MRKILPFRLNASKPYYVTGLGAAYLGDARDLLVQVPDSSINLVMTSPPFALQRKKSYGNVSATEYVRWFRPFAIEIRRILTEDGSFVVDLGGSWNKGKPTKNLYNYHLLIDLVENLGFHLAQDFFWHNPARLPSPAEWVNVKRVRVKDAVDTIWWLSKTPHPKADNRNVLREYSVSMKGLLKNGYKARLRPSGHDISTKFKRDNKGAIPPNMIEQSCCPCCGEPISRDFLSPNLLELANTDSNSEYLRRCRKLGIEVHPARYPKSLPEFFLRLLTNEGDVVLDPFAGSNVTGEAAQELRRKWIAFELLEEYVTGSMLRFISTAGFHSENKLPSEITGSAHGNAK